MAIVGTPPTFAIFDCVSAPASSDIDLPGSAIAFIAVIETMDLSSQTALEARYQLSTRIVRTVVGDAAETEILSWSLNPLEIPPQCQRFSPGVGDEVLVVAVRSDAGLTVVGGASGVVSVDAPKFRRWRKAVKRSIRRSRSS